MPNWILSLSIVIARPFVQMWRLMFSLKISEATESDDQNDVWRLSDGRLLLVPSRYIRAKVLAPKWAQVEDCLVSVRSIKRGDKLQSESSSSLAWTGKQHGDRFKSQRLASGDSKEFDICRLDVLRNQLQVTSERSVAGADIYGSGDYTIEVIATGKDIRKATKSFRVTLAEELTRTSVN